jgi:translocation and assembly module TamB
VTLARLSAIVITGLLLALVVLFAVAFATGTGARALARGAERLAPVHLDIDGLEGSLLRSVRAASVSFETGGTTVTLEDARIAIDWPRTWVLRGVVVDSISAARVRLRSAPAQPRTVPRSLTRPMLPFAVAVSRIDIGRLESNDWADGFQPRISAKGVNLAKTWSVAAFEAGAPRYSVIGHAQLASGGALEGVLEVEAIDPDAQGRVEIGGALGRPTARVYLAAPVAVTADVAVELDQRIDPRVTVSAEPQRVAFGDATLDGFTATLEAEFGAALHFRLESGVAAGDWAGRRIEAFALDVAGTPDAYDGRVAGRVQADGIPDAVVAGRFRGDREALRVEEGRVVAPNGRAAVQGRVAYRAGAVEGEAELDRVDPAYWVPWLRGEVSGRVEAVYDENRVAIRAPGVRGTINGAPIELILDASRDADAWTVERAVLTSEENRVDASFLWATDAIEGTGTFDLRRIERLYPAVKGRVAGRFVASGTVEAPTIAAEVDASTLHYDAFDVSGARIVLDVRAGRVRDLTVRAERLARGEIGLDAVTLRASGVSDAFEASLDARFEGTPQALSLRGGVRDGTLGLTATEGAVLGAGGETIRLDRETRVSRSRAGAWSATSHCWLRAGGDGRLCIDALQHDRIGGRIEAIPVALVEPFVEGLPEVTGSIEGEFDFRRARAWTGRASLRTREFALPDLGARDGQRADVRLPDVVLAATVNGDSARLTADVRGAAEGSLVADVALQGLSAKGALQGSIRVELADLAPFAQLSRRIGEMAGRADGEIAVGGTLLDPHLSGVVKLSSGHIAWVDPRVELSDLAVELVATSLDRVDIVGTGIGGTGRFQVKGQFLEPLTDARRLRIELDSDSVEVRIPEGDVHATTDLVLEWQPGAFDLSGRVEVPRARIRIAEIPASTVRRSGDVVVVDREVARPDVTRLAVDVRVELGDDVRFAGFGLDTRLTGRVRLRETRDGAIRLNGELRLADGTFTAFGQTLEIERGRLTYAGPIDAPVISARASRRIKRDGEIVIAGIDISGRAGAVESTLYSTPAMSDSEVLSYLVLGRPLDTASEEEGSSMTGAAVALGLKGAAPVIDEIRTVIGLEELTAKGGGEEMSLVAGKRISKNIFVRYTYQTFTRMSALLIELALTDRLRVEATAAEAPAMDLIYRVGRHD